MPGRKQEAEGRNDVNALFLVDSSDLLSTKVLIKPPFPRAKRPRLQVG